MVSNVPIVRQIAWISIIPQVMIMGLFTFVFFLLNLKTHFYLA